MSYGMFKATAIGAELADELAKRLPSTYTITQGASSGYPTLLISEDATPTTGEKVIFVRINALAWTTATNSIGGDQAIYDKVVIQMVTEKNYESTTDSVQDILGPAQLLPVLGALLKKGTRVEWYRTANGTVPAVGGITGTPDGSWDPMLNFPGVGW